MDKKNTRPHKVGELYGSNRYWYWYAWDDKNKRWQISDPFENYDEAKLARDRMINDVYPGEE